MASVKRRAGLLASLVISLCAVVIYLPVVVVPYAFKDDYTELGWAHGLLSTEDFWEWFAKSGRPVAWPLSFGAYSLAPDIDGLRWVRLVSVLGIALLGVLLHHSLTRAGMNRWLSMAASISVISLPSFQVYAAWASAYSAAYSAILAGLASLIAAGALDAQRRVATIRLAAAVALLLCSLLIYQPTAMFFWVLAAISLLRPSESLARALRLFGVHLLVAAASLAFDFAIFKVAVHYYGPASVERSSLTHDIPGKVRWFVEQPLVNALDLSALTRPRLLAEAVSLFAIVGITLLHRKKGLRSLGFVAIAVILVPLAYLPNLVVEESWASYRTIVALSSLIAIYTWLSVWGIGTAILRPGMSPTANTAARAVGATAIALLVSGAGLLASRNVTTLFVKPQSLELNVLRTTLRAGPAREVRKVVFVRPGGWQGAAPLVRYDEFGLPSSVAPWVPYPAVFLVLREQRHLADRLTVDDLPPETKSIPSADVVVDMRRLQDLRVGWTFWTLEAPR